VIVNGKINKTFNIDDSLPVDSWHLSIVKSSSLSPIFLPLLPLHTLRPFSSMHSATLSRDAGHHATLVTSVATIGRTRGGASGLSTCQTKATTVLTDYCWDLDSSVWSTRSAGTKLYRKYITYCYSQTQASTRSLYIYMYIIYIYIYILYRSILAVVIQ